LLILNSKIRKQTPKMSLQGQNIVVSTQSMSLQTNKPILIGNLDHKEPSQELSKVFDGVSAYIANARFINETKIALQIDEKDYYYNRTKITKDKYYFQCINRKKGETTGKKC